MPAAAAGARARLVAWRLPHCLQTQHSGHETVPPDPNSGAMCNPTHAATADMTAPPRTTAQCVVAGGSPHRRGRISRRMHLQLWGSPEIDKFVSFRYPCLPQLLRATSSRPICDTRSSRRSGSSRCCRIRFPSFSHDARARDRAARRGLKFGAPPYPKNPCYPYDPFQAASRSSYIQTSARAAAAHVWCSHIACALWLTR